MIKNIIFDLGNVLIEVDFDRFRTSLLNEGVSKQVFEELFYSQEIKDKFESGSISNREFMVLMKDKLGPNISKKRFIELVSDMFTEIPEMKEFILKLAERKKYRLILLSNTNSYHFNFIKKKFDYINQIKNFALSYRLKMIKPSTIIYETVLKRYNLKANETLFIDDLKDNCNAAKAMGIKTICYKDYKSFKEKFDKMIKIN